MVSKSSPISAFEDVNRPGVRLAVKGGGAYDLWISRHWKRATIVRSPTLEASYQAYVEGSLEALAGLRPRLLQDVARAQGHRLLEGGFMSVSQAIGCPKVDGPDGAVCKDFLRDFVENARQPGGLVERLFAEHGVVGRLSLPGGR